MKRILALLLTLGFLVPANAASTDTVTATTAFVVERVVPVEDKVVELRLTLVDDETTVAPAKSRSRRVEKFPGHATCSGSFVSPFGDIITARHCTEDAKAIEVMTSDRRTYNATVVYQSKTHDLAVIHIDRRDTPFFSLAATVTRGEAISVLGSPTSITDVLTQGIVAKVDGDITLLDCAALPGNSGGPVFNKDGQLIGVLTSGIIVMLGTTHLNIAQGLDAVLFTLIEAVKAVRGDGSCSR